MKTMHLHLVEPRTITDTRVAEIHEAFTAVWGNDPDSLEVQHLEAVISISGVTVEDARREFSLRRIRHLREM
jgi:hypothetical protein